MHVLHLVLELKQQLAANSFVIVSSAAHHVSICSTAVRVHIVPISHAPRAYHRGASQSSSDDPTNAND